MTDKDLYPFSHPWQKNKKRKNLVALLGGKGANLGRMMTRMGLPVPEGFTIPTTWCASHMKADSLNPDLASKLDVAVAKLERVTGRKFGDPVNPLLVSVRSGAPVSMPGMMETILNLGMNDKTVEALAKQTNERFAWDSYRRFMVMYSVTALGLDPAPFNERFEAAKAFAGTDQLPVDMLQLLVERYKKYGDVPQNINDQLHGAILAVFRSWGSEKAAAYRDIEGISATMGTAVNVQRMVFGNMNDNSGTGVAFTRNPNTGENVRFGDFLVNAQGEDVVDGSHVTLPLSDMSEVFPTQAAELETYMQRLEGEYGDMCDIEFTIEDGKLFMLQTRAGKRNSKAAVRIAIDMVAEGRINADTATERIEKAFAGVGGTKTSGENDNFTGELIGSGVAASPGNVVGKAYFTSDAAFVAATERGEDVILIRNETSPEDVKGMGKSVGILTATGGLVSHAAVVARGWGIPCVVGFEGLTVEAKNASFLVGKGKVINEGDLVRIDGETGEVWA